MKTLEHIKPSQLERLKDERVKTRMAISRSKDTLANTLGKEIVQHAIENGCG